MAEPKKTPKQIVIDEKGNFPLQFRVVVGGMTILAACRHRHLARVVASAAAKDSKTYSYE